MEDGFFNSVEVDCRVKVKEVVGPVLVGVEMCIRKEAEVVLD